MEKGVCASVHQEDMALSETSSVNENKDAVSDGKMGPR